MSTTSHPQAGQDPSGGRYEVQARRIVRRGAVVISNDTRLAATIVRADALRTAAEWVADGFTVWVYLVRDHGGTRPVYEAVETLSPPAPTRIPADGARSGGGSGARTIHHRSGTPSAAVATGEGTAA